MKVKAYKGKPFLAAVLGVSMIAGCNSSPPPLRQAPAAEGRAAVQARQYFDKAHGDFSALSPQDQAAYNQIMGGASPGQASWKLMSRNGYSQNGAGLPGGAAEAEARGSTAAPPR